MLAVHRWTPGAVAPASLPCRGPAHAVSEAWLGGRRDLVVLAEAWEPARRPTPWEARHGRVFVAPAAWALRGRFLDPVHLPADLDSDYGLVARRRPARHDPFDWVVPGAGGDTAPPAPPPVPSPDEEAVHAALLEAGRPVSERGGRFGPGFPYRRERVVRNGVLTLYIGHGTWLLLGRDVPLTPAAADALAAAGRKFLDAGPMTVMDVRRRLMGSHPSAAGIDGAAVMAALLRRCRDVAVDDVSGMAAVLTDAALADRDVVRGRLATRIPVHLASRR